MAAQTHDAGISEKILDGCPLPEACLYVNIMLCYVVRRYSMLQDTVLRCKTLITLQYIVRCNYAMYIVRCHAAL